MYHHIIEDSAGYFHIINAWRFRIPGTDLYHMHIADLTGTNHIVYPSVIMVKPSAESDLKLDIRLFSGINGFMNLLQVIIYRLLAEYMLSCLCRFNDIF